MTTDEGYMNIIWFARDTADNIIVAESLESAVPEFVKADALKTDLIAEKLGFPKAIDRDRRGTFDIRKMASQHGFFAYIGDDPYESIYRLIVVPPKRKKYSDFTSELKELLNNNQVPFDAAETSHFEISEGMIMVQNKDS